VGGRAVGVPGAVRMLEAVQRAHGRLPWARLFEPAIALADRGFPVGERLHRQLAADVHLAQDVQARRYFFDAAGAPWPIGHRLRNPALAEVLRAIAARGADALHRGAVAADIVARVRGHAGNPGRLSEADLAAYRPRQRAPLCADWRQRYRVCGFPPPSSGQIAIMQILGMLERMAPAPLAEGVPTPAWLHVYTEAARLAFADRDRYLADPDYVAAPGGDWRALLASAYLAQRAALIGPTRMPRAPAGQPAGEAGARAAMPAQPESGTSHVSIVDAEGRAVALTTTIEAEFGARLMSDGGSGKAGGFLLNNQLTDFSFVPADAASRPVANRVQPGKRPRSSMSPTLVFDLRDGRLVMTLGSPGGAAIIHYTAKTLLGTLAWGLDVQRAIDLPNFATFGGALLLEAGRYPDAAAAALRALGHEVRELELTSGVQAIERRPGGWFGGADPRREGVVVGE
ncbi:MAG: gamma-glutamyltransferase family protein, partial [Comamonadaceae bacterium]|nr:gamma-glutamyltransferase family protein [Comamonadaceae bacterium]